MFSWIKSVMPVKVKNRFAQHELQCKCKHPECNKNATLTRRQLKLLNNIRHELCEPMIVNSAVRCQQHNTDIGSFPNSFHTTGQATDIHCPSPEYMERVKELAIKHGAKGIGEYPSRNFLHIDSGQRYDNGRKRKTLATWTK